MRHYSPFPILTDMRGMRQLGQANDEKRFVPPPVIPDPRQSDRAAEEFINIWLDWAGHRERVIDQWARELDGLIALRSATCKDIIDYNRAALLHFGEEMFFYRKLLLAGANPNTFPKPQIPIIFASAVQHVEGKQPGDFSIRHKVPCRQDRNGRPLDEFPDFDKMKVFGPTERLASAFTPSGGQLALAPIVAFWGFAAIAALTAGAVLIAREFRKAITGEEVQKLKLDVERGLQDQDQERAAFTLRCVEQQLEKLGTDFSPEQFIAAREQCVESSLKVFPAREPEIETGGFGRTVLLAGIGIGAIFGSMALFRYARRKD